MTTSLIQAVSVAAEGAGKLIATFVNGLTPDELERLQRYLKAGCHLGIKTGFADTGVEVMLYAEHPNGKVYSLQRATVPASLEQVHVH